MISNVRFKTHNLQLGQRLYNPRIHLTIHWTSTIFKCIRSLKSLIFNFVSKYQLALFAVRIGNNSPSILFKEIIYYIGPISFPDPSERTPNKQHQCPTTSKHFFFKHPRSINIDPWRAAKHSLWLIFLNDEISHWWCMIKTQIHQNVYLI